LAFGLCFENQRPKTKDQKPMFKVKAEYSEQFDVRADLSSVRDFFASTKNFVEMMPNLESIITDSNGVALWKIRADLPLIGSMAETFAVELTENSNEKIEWAPAANETKNFLRYAADFLEKGSKTTFVQITQAVELRRNKAADLHFLAGFAGEAVISQEMQKQVSAMIKTFLQKARIKLEQK
jgi:carbon monoxide dehydrogenase subunit G